MAVSFEKIVTSPIFTFFVGAEGTPINVHNALVSHHSSTLDTLMNGEMAEAKAGSAKLPEIDVDTFVHFCQWLYTSRYGMPYCDGHSKIRSEIRSEMKSDAESVPWDHGLTTAERKRKEKNMKWDGSWDYRITQAAIDKMAGFPVSTHSAQKQSLWETFIRYSSHDLAGPPRKNPQEVKVNWTDVFLGHARMHCFADVYGIAPLQELSWKAVRAALSDFECQAEQIDVLVQLIGYTIENTPSTSFHQGLGLRLVVLEHVVIVFEILIENRQFRDLLQKHHDFAVELLTLLPQRFV